MMKMAPVFALALLSGSLTTVSRATLAFQVPASYQTQNYPAPKRDVSAENIVAKLFEDIRRDSKEHHLHRIEDRSDLQQLTCTVAVTGSIPHFANGFPVLGNYEKFKDVPSALYRTSNPSEVTLELQRIATYKLRRSGKERYSVAVWSFPSGSDGEGSYWVGIELYYSSGMEFYLNHFSDQMEWKNEWKQFVTPQCTGAK